MYDYELMYRQWCIKRSDDQSLFLEDKLHSILACKVTKIWFQDLPLKGYFIGLLL